MKEVNPLFALTALCWLVFLVGLSAAKSTGHMQPIWGGIEQFVGGNRWMHFYMATILSSLCHLAVPSHRRKGWLFLALMVGCAIDESFQYFLPLRSFNPLDFLATVTGLLLGWFLISVLTAFVGWCRTK